MTAIFKDRMQLAPNWLQPGRTAAVCLTLDDVHPSRSQDQYEAGGDLERGMLRHVEWLLERHPQLGVTLLVTPDWRATSPRPAGSVWSRVPVVRSRMHHSRPLRRGTMRLERHPHFVEYVMGLARVEVALHGLHHLAVGVNPVGEFDRKSEVACRRALREGIEIFRDAGLNDPNGFGPPGWELPAPLQRALAAEGFAWVASARDLATPVTPNAVTAGSGLRGAPLAFPARLDAGILHFPANYQATSDSGRAHAIVAAGGLLSIKAHAIKDARGHIALDGLDRTYRETLHRLFSELEDSYGESLWWGTMSDLAAVAGVGG